MVAVSMEDARPFKRPERAHRRKGWTHQESAAHGDLCYWGQRYTRILLSEGFSSMSPFNPLFAGESHEFSSRILIPEMTPRAWEINMRVWGIRPQDYSWALCAKYALPIRNDQGFTIEPEAIAECLGKTVKAYYHCVARGRKAYEKALFC